MEFFHGGVFVSRIASRKRITIVNDFFVEVTWENSTLMVLERMKVTLLIQKKKIDRNSNFD